MADVKRINELYKKFRNEGLTDEEKEEQAKLRREYIESVKADLRARLGDKNDYKNKHGGDLS